MKRQSTGADNVALVGERPEDSPDMSHSIKTAEAHTDHEVRRPSLTRRIWNRWLKIAEAIGTVQMVIILTLVYWTMITVMAIPFRFLSDPLVLKRSSRPRWVKRTQPSDVLKNMRRQF